ncbi:MAG TPA: chloride channel protein [Terriglobales bacterium]|nr:chloride channel protein [Terriglobales bacterium]
MNVGLQIAERLRIRENQIFLALTLLVGVIAGLAAVLFTLAIEATRHTLFGMNPGVMRTILVPTVVSLVSGFLLAKYFSDARGSGIPQTEAAYHLNQGEIPSKTVWGKFLTGVLCVGSGHSMGREGPSVQIGAGIASVVGRWLGLSRRRVQELVPVGAAAALSAAFNTPLAAVLFALEEIIGDMNAAVIGSTVLASVSAVIVERSILGNEALFRVPQYHLVHPAELLAYAVLGVAGGITSLVFCKGLLRLRAFFQSLPRSTRVLQPAMGGLAIGILLVFSPQVMGVGYEYVDQALNGSLPLKMLLLLCALKLVATIVSYASGNAGGIFAPSLYLGAMLGGAVGVLVNRVAPFPTGDVGAYALVGMGALFAGIIRAPMTSVLMIFELTQDYQIVIALMVANMISFLISRKYQPKPIYHALLEQDGVHLPGPETRLSVGTWRAKDLMTREFTVVSADATVQQAWEIAQKNRAECFLVGEDGRVHGLLLRSEVEKAVHAGQGQRPVTFFLLQEWQQAFPDYPLELTLETFSKTPGLLPVVSRTDASKVEGIITRDSWLKLLGQPHRSAGP